MGRSVGCALVLMFGCTVENPLFAVPGDDTAAGTTGGTATVDATSHVTGGPAPGTTSGGPADTTGAIDHDTGEPSGTGTTTTTTDPSTTDPSTTMMADMSTSGSSSSTMPVDMGTGMDDSSGGMMALDMGTNDLCLHCGDPGCGECPDTPKVGFDGKFEIDAYEVTNKDYAAFLAAPVAKEILGPECVQDTGFLPGGPWPPAPEKAEFPVVYVDWCDAYAYCKWAGKRLCGAIGGGPGGFGLLEIKDKNSDQWFRACSGTNGNVYPYGAAFKEAQCNDDWAMKNGPVQVGSMPGCKGSLTQLLDMSGNVWEMTDACDGDGPQANCLRRGGSYMSDDPVDLRCDLQSFRKRNLKYDHVGFRCCTDL